MDARYDAQSGRAAGNDSDLVLSLSAGRLHHPRPLNQKRSDIIMDDVNILATGLGFPEGPVVCADGSVVLVELRNQRCSRVAPDGKVSLFSDCGGGPNGLAVGRDGFFYLCNNGGNRYVEGHP